MIRDESPDEELIRSLPLPLASMFRRVLNSTSAAERDEASLKLWETSLQLLASVAIVEYAALENADPAALRMISDATAKSHGLWKPSTGQWWAVARKLVPVLAASDAGFAGVRDFLFGKARSDSPWLTGLDTTLREIQESKVDPRPTVNVQRLIDRIVKYRNDRRHTGLVPTERTSASFLKATGEFFRRLDVLAGRQLVYIANVRKHSSGAWLIERFSLMGEQPKKLETLQLPRDATARLPAVDRVYLESGAERLVPLDPFALYEADPPPPAFYIFTNQLAHGLSYACGITGRVTERKEAANDERVIIRSIFRWDGSVPIPQPPSAEMGNIPATAPGPVPDEDDANWIGQFRLVGRLGGHGRRIVYRAVQTPGDRTVALKCMRSGDTKSEAQFNREFEALSHVENLHLPQAIMSSVHGDQMYYAMEFVDGVNLASVWNLLAASPSTKIGPNDWCGALAAGREEVGAQLRSASAATPAPSSALPAAPAGRFPKRGTTKYIRLMVEIIGQAADAADALHRRGFIHCDIRPANIMVTPEGRAFLIDLGSAQPVDEKGLGPPRSGASGPLQYACPEQMLDDVRLDQRADVYGLGATLWELVTLRPLYGTDEEDPRTNLSHKKQYTDPARAHSCNRNVPRALDKIIRKCLVIDRNRRCPSAAELKDQLEKLLGQKRVWKSRWTIARSDLQGIIVVAAVVCLIWFLMHHPRPEKSSTGSIEQVVSKQNKPPEKEIWIPKNWQALSDNRRDPDNGTWDDATSGRALWKSLKWVGSGGKPTIQQLGKPLKLRLIYRRPNETYAPPFYILETKVSNALYDAFAAGKRHMDGKKRKIGDGAAKKIAPDPHLAVTDITVTDAWEFCQWARTALFDKQDADSILVRLPTLNEWDQAADFDEWLKNKRPAGKGPYTSEIKMGRPLPVGSDAGSPRWGVKDMAGNGLEYTDNVDQNRQVSQPFNADDGPFVYVRGQNWTAAHPLGYDEIQELKAKGEHPVSYTNAEPECSFRFIVEIRLHGKLEPADRAAADEPPRPR